MYFLMDDNIGKPANVTPEVRRQLLCYPPEGVFDYKSSSLRWVKRRYGKVLYDSVFIPKYRLEDFRKGEDQRGVCSFFTRATKPGSKRLKENDGRAANTPVCPRRWLNPSKGAWKMSPPIPCTTSNISKETSALCLLFKMLLL